MNCITCGKALTGKQTKFCCIDHKYKTNNFKYQNSLAQQKRGNKRKLILIEMSGGKCQKCGYNKNMAALCFHHKISNTKEFELDLRALSNRRWEYILKEYNKCILLCTNCHMETHYPESNLDEKFLEIWG